MEEEIQKIYDAQPLLFFSFYTEMQKRAVIELGQEVLSNLANGATSSGVPLRTYNKFWFWTLGSYEVLRTMSQHGKCFDEPVRSETLRLKRRLAEIRMPFAKQEFQGKSVIIQNEASITGIGIDGK